MGNIYADRFKGKVMLITGGTTGIGRATAIRAAREGADVVIVGRNLEKGQEAVKEAEEKGCRISFLQYDLTTEEAAKEVVEKTVSLYGKLDIAVNNVGIMGKAIPIHMLPKEEMDRVFNVNFYSTVYCCKYELSQMVEQKQGGAVINNASVAGLIGFPCLPAYNASKHAVNGLTKTLAIDYAPYGIRVNSVNPGTTDTPLTQAASAMIRDELMSSKEKGGDMSQASALVFLKNTNLQARTATPEEQAASILFLASEDASHMTGEIVATDGGFTAF